MGACNSNGADMGFESQVAVRCGRLSPRTGKPANMGSVTGCGDFASLSGQGTLRKTQATKIDRSKLVVTQSISSRDLHYVEADLIGKGGFGSVRMCTCRSSGRAYAMKNISVLDPKSHKRFSQAIANIRLTDHPHIMKLYKIFEGSQKYDLVLELCTGGDLHDHIVKKTRFDESEAATVMNQLLQAVHYMHNLDICHRDLKPENLIYKTHGASSVLKVIDFGFACKSEPGAMRTTVLGTPSYIAPEVLAKCYDKRCDVWSCGAILYTMLCGHPPFLGNSTHEILAKVREGRYTFMSKVWLGVTRDAKVAVRRLMASSLDQRYTAEEGLGGQWIMRNAQGWRPRMQMHPTLLERLRAFQTANWFKKAALHVISRQIGDDQTEGFRDIFRSLDTDNDGTLSLAELQTGLLIAGLSEAAPDIEEIVEGLDTDGNGNVDYTEFIAAALDRNSYLNGTVCLAAFNFFDLDRDSKITRQELGKVFGNGGFGDEAPAAHEELLRDVDGDGDGTIDFEEFMAMMAGS